MGGAACRSDGSGPGGGYPPGGGSHPRGRRVPTRRWGRALAARILGKVQPGQLRRLPVGLLGEAKWRPLTLCWQSLILSGDHVGFLDATPPYFITSGERPGSRRADSQTRWLRTWPPSGRGTLRAPDASHDASHRGSLTVSSRSRLVVLVSGAGTNLQALLDACASDSYGAQVVAVGADRDHVAALARAEAAGIPTITLRVAISRSAMTGTGRSPRHAPTSSRI